ncbi:hypothetical protein E8E13_003778 [Curvularia kusanoi]|uniref:LysM domain-containing protein n=1 Tax=Curvularia kusanoi TaxID=90978 RepID=A0A9P4T596_CURKU|nr:hypothetical protein E8E13_003778 [Curvularia kusanoi]
MVALFSSSTFASRLPPESASRLRSSGGGQTSTATKTSAMSQSATTTTTIPTPAQKPSPVREGMSQDCVGFYLQQTGDLGWSMASDAGISLDQFYEWNPAVGSDCQNLWPDYYYCIAVKL